MNTQKIRKRWQPEEKHEDATIDYAISQIYDLCAEVEQPQAENERLKDLLRQVTVMYPQFSNIKQRRLMINIEQALKDFPND